MLMIEKLKGLLSLKERITNNNWEKIEKELNVIFPSDYKYFIDNYGAGAINDFLWIFSPFEDNKNINSLDRLSELVYYDNITDNKKADSTEKINYYDGKSGLFPIGVSDNGDEIFMDFQGEEVSIEVYETRELSPIVFNVSFLEFLVEILTNDSYKDLFAEDFLQSNNYYNWQ